MWEKILLATAVTLSLHIFSGIDLSDVKSPVSSVSPSANTANSKLPNLSYIEQSFQFSTMKNIKNFMHK